jgi:hydroxyacylglutathione hydrolase
MEVEVFNHNPMDCNSYLYYQEEQALIIDVSSPPEFLVENLRKKFVSKVFIAYTHAHFDHIIYGHALEKLLEKERINFSSLACRADKTVYNTARGADIIKEYLSLFGLNQQYPADFELPRIDCFLDDGAELGFGDFIMITTPGHSNDSVCYYSEADEILFTGDTLFSDGGFGRTDLPTGSITELKRSLEKIFRLPDSVTIYPGHGNIANLGLQKQHFNFYTPSNLWR